VPAVKVGLKRKYEPELFKTTNGLPGIVVESTYRFGTPELKTK
jgi:hypothetical protein